jgi:hypothetical protein
MLSGHVAATRARAQASESEYLIAAQDTTYYNYSGQAQMSGLGVIQGKVRGLMQHNVLLMMKVGCRWVSSTNSTGLEAVRWIGRRIAERVSEVVQRAGCRQPTSPGFSNVGWSPVTARVTSLTSSKPSASRMSTCWCGCFNRVGSKWLHAGGRPVADGRGAPQRLRSLFSAD